MSAPIEPISINIQHKNAPNNNSVLNLHEQYIIRLNESLLIDTQKQRDELKDKEKELSEITDENERQENSLRYLRGLLKNIRELEGNASSSNKIYKSMFTKHGKVLSKHVVYHRMDQK